MSASKFTKSGQNHLAFAFKKTRKSKFLSPESMQFYSGVNVSTEGKKILAFLWMVGQQKSIDDEKVIEQESEPGLKRGDSREEESGTEGVSLFQALDSENTKV